MPRFILAPDGSFLIASDGVSFLVVPDLPTGVPPFTGNVTATVLLASRVAGIALLDGQVSGLQLLRGRSSAMALLGANVIGKRLLSANITITGG